MKRIWTSVRGLLWLGLGVSAAALSFAFWVMVIYPKESYAINTRAVEINVGAQPKMQEVARTLEAHGVLRHSTAFAIYMRWIGADKHLRTGTLRIPPDLTPAEVAKYVARGLGAIQVVVTIPEGFNRFDIGARLDALGLFSAARFIEATNDQVILQEYGITSSTAEGYLFPDTYEFWDTALPETVLRRMLANWKRRTDLLFEANPSALERMQRLLGWTPREVIILASIVEKEAAIIQEQPTIAGVFFNRLTSPKFPSQLLQADPTIIYGCLAEPERAVSCRDFSGRITKAMLLDGDNRYNTYQHSGLPPGPICNPGLTALQAALQPERHNFFYFVANGDRRHRFSDNLNTHNRAVADYWQSR